MSKLLTWPSDPEKLKVWLKENDYDGLYGEECGCLADDLFPCGCSGEDVEECEPGIRIACPGKRKKGGCAEYGDCDWHVAPKTEKNLARRQDENGNTTPIHQKSVNDLTHEEWVECVVRIVPRAADGDRATMRKGISNFLYSYRQHIEEGAKEQPAPTGVEEAGKWKPVLTKEETIECLKWVAGMDVREGPASDETLHDQNDVDVAASALYYLTGESSERDI